MNSGVKQSDWSSHSNDRHHLGNLYEISSDNPKKFDWNGQDYLALRHGNEVKVLDNACPHLGGDLSKGLLVDGTITCPLHRARFDVGTGTLLEPPGCKHLKQYRVEIIDEQVYAYLGAPKAQTRNGSVRVLGNDQAPATIAIIGAGAAGTAAATKLRDENFEGQILLITNEKQLPYERTKLSKTIVSEPSDAQTLSEQDLDELRITYLRDLEVKEVNWRDGICVSGQDKSIEVDRLIVATGSRARQLGVAGESLDGVFNLRNMNDARNLESFQQDANNIVMVGGGFISLELAATLCKNHKITIVMREQLPLQNVLGEVIARKLKNEFLEQGVDFIDSSEVVAFEGQSKIESVLLDNGKRLSADLAVVAIGADPVVDILPKTCVNNRGAVSADENLALTDVENIYVAGDIATVPSAWGDVRIEHWRWAQQMGRAAALNALGAKAPFVAAPFFWTMLCAKGSYIYLGHASQWDKIAYTGDVHDKDFIAWYIDGDRIPAVFGHGHADLLSKIELSMQSNGPLKVDDWAEYF